MYGCEKATALGEKFVAKNILEVRDSAKIFKLLKALASRNVPQSIEDLIYWMFLFLYEKWCKGMGLGVTLGSPSVVVSENY